MKVEIIQGASSAFYGPNAFNGVISMKTISPFIQPGLLIQYKFGSRNLFENSFRLANKYTNNRGQDLLLTSLMYLICKHLIGKQIIWLLLMEQHQKTTQEAMMP